MVNRSYDGIHDLWKNVHSNNRWPLDWVQPQDLPNIRFSACFFSFISCSDRAGLDLDLSSSFLRCCAYRFSSSNEFRKSSNLSRSRRSPRLTPSAYSDPKCSGSIRRIFPSFLDCMPQSGMSDETSNKERSSDTDDETPKLHERLANQLDEITEV